MCDHFAKSTVLGAVNHKDIDMRSSHVLLEGEAGTIPSTVPPTHLLRLVAYSGPLQTMY